MSEHDEQVALFKWVALKAHVMPELKLLYAVPNAAAGAQRGQAGKMKAEGLKSGVPDVCLPVPRRAYHGLYIEMKMPGRRPTVSQEWWLNGLSLQGYMVYICYSCEQAQTVITEYLALGPW